MSENPHERIHRYLMDLMDASERPLFIFDLKRDAELRSLYLHHVNLDIALEGKAALGAGESSDAGIRRTLSEGVRTERWIGDWRRVALGIAAVFVVGFLLLSGGGWGRVMHVGEGAEIRSGRAARIARAGEVLKAGERVHSQGKGGVRLSVKGLGRVELGPHTSVGCLPRERVLEVERGFVEVDADRQPMNRPWRQRTPHAETSVMGTRFALASSEGRTALRVSEGSVRLKNLVSGETESVVGGRRAFVEGGELVGARESRLGSVLLLTSRTAPSGDFVGTGDLEQRVKAVKMLGLIAERLVVARLWGLGFRVEVRHFDEVQKHDLEDRALVVVSMMADGAGQSGLKRIGLVRERVPVICLDAEGYRPLGMVADDGSGWGYADDGLDAMVMDRDHALNRSMRTSGMGLLGSVKGWGLPNLDGGVVHAALAQRADRAVWFSFDKGSAMSGIAAPDRRVGLFLEPHSITVPDSPLWHALDASVDWAVSEGRDE
jgi:hypothetical protein